MGAGSFAGGIMQGIQSADQMFRAHAELGLREKESAQREIEAKQRQYAFDRLKQKEEEQDAADKILSEEYAKLGAENATGVMKHAAMGQEFATPEAAQTAVKRADILPGDEEAVVAKDDPFKANPVVSTPVMAKTSEYDVHKNIGDRLAKANYGARSQQWHQKAKKMQQEGALTAYVGLRENYLDLKQAEAIFNESGMLRGVKFNAYDPKTLIANITMPDGKTMDVNLQQQIGQYIDPKTYAETKLKLDQANKAGTSPELAMMAMMEKGRQADQADMIKLVLGANKGGGSGSGSSTGKGGKSGGFDTHANNSYSWWGVDGPIGLQKYVNEYFKGAGGGDTVSPERISNTGTLVSQLMSGEAGNSKVKLESLMKIADGMAQRAEGMKFIGEDKDEKLRDAYRPYAELHTNGKWYNQVKGPTGVAYRIGSDPTDPSQYPGMTPALIASKEAALIAPLLNKVAANPAGMAELEQKFGAQKAAALMQAHKANQNPTTQGTAPPVPAKDNLTPEQAAVMQQYKRPPSIGQEVADAASAAWNKMTGLSKSLQVKNFTQQLARLRKTKDFSTVDASQMLRIIDDNPELEKQLNAQELFAIKHVAGRK